MLNKEIKESKLYNTLWYMFGSLSYGFTSLVYLIIITRVIGIEASGQFSFAFAFAATFYVIGVYFGSAFQITDISKKYSDTDYIYNRITTILIMFVLTLIVSLISGYFGNKLILIILLIIYRAFDALLDSFHAIIQKKDKIYKIGKLTFFRTILLLLVFLIISLLFKNITISIISLVLTDLIYSILIEYKTVKNLIKRTKFNNYKNIMLLIEGFSVFIFTFLAMYILNSPKYAIDANLNDEIQGIFGIIFMPSSFMSLISLYLVHPFLNDMTENIEEKNISNQNKLLLKLTSIIVVFGLFLTLIAYLIGIPFLELLYNVDLKSYRIDLLIIMFGTILYSIYTLLSSVLIAMRKNIYQVLILIIVSIVAIITCDLMTKNYGIRGASYAYLIIMFIQVILYIAVYLYFTLKKEQEKKVAIRLMGGLGNQMFQYAMIRTFAKENDATAYIDLRGITNKTHNVYGLNHCNISKNVKIVKKYKSLKALIDYLLYGLSWIILKKPKIYKDIQPMINSAGIYCVPSGYVDLSKLECQDNYMVGYFATRNYINKYDNTIKDELQITDKLTGKNKEVEEEIKKVNSVCIHIRKGDYVGSMFDVCTDKYYYDSIKEINRRVKNAKFYIFSDDILWVKENMKFKDDITFIDWKNNQYEDLKLMSSCKHFIMSNSTFSFWAQYLSNNDKKIVIAPSKWYKDDTKSEIYDENWILINPERSNNNEN